LDFRSLLLGLKQMGSGLHGLPGEGGFDSHAVASHFHMPVKRASNDLRRLWRMGFLKRTSVKRSCLIRGGKLCHKGFEYRYHLSSQGVDYVKWLQGGKMAEDFAHEALISEVLSHLPEGLKDRLSMLNLAKATRRYKGPSRNMNLLDSNAVPVTHLSAERTRLQSENAKLKEANTIQQITLANLQQTINNYKEQNTSLNNALAQAIIWAASNKNSAESWKQALFMLTKLSGLPLPLPTFGPTNDADASLFDPRTDISRIPAVVGGAEEGSPLLPFPSFATSWREHYGKTYTLTETTPEGPDRILTTWKITPETMRTLFEKWRTPAQDGGLTLDRIIDEHKRHMKETDREI
jgi:hypothetical protein